DCRLMPIGYDSDAIHPMQKTKDNLMQYPLTVTEIVSWFRSKQLAVQGSEVSLVDIKRRDEGPKPAAGADFDGSNTMGRINGWVSGEFDFEALRTSDGKDIFWRHIKVSVVGEELEQAYSDFLKVLQNPPSET